MYLSNLKKQIVIRVKESTYEWTKSEAEKYGVKQSDFIRYILETARDNFDLSEEAMKNDMQ